MFHKSLFEREDMHFGVIISRDSMDFGPLDVVKIGLDMASICDVFSEVRNFVDAWSPLPVNEDEILFTGSK